MKLDNVIEIGNETFEVNAKHSEVATQVEENLSVKLYKEATPTDEPTEVIEYDGSEAQELHIVPVTGGSFTGPISAETHETTDFNSTDILNYEELENFVGGLKGTSLYRVTKEPADDEPNITPVEPSGEAMHIGTVVGSSDYLEFFHENNTALDTYLYICDDTGDIYLGGSDKYPQRIADKALTLAESHKLKVDLTSGDAAYFDGGSDVNIGVKGILPVAKGGTGANSLSKIKVGEATKADTAALANKLYVGRDITVELDKEGPGFFRGDENCYPGVTGILPVANGGTGVDNLDDIKVGSAVQADEADVATKLKNARNFKVNLSSTSTVSFNGEAGCFPGVYNQLGISNGGTGATTAADACTNIINNQDITPRTVTTRAGAYQYESDSTSYGLDLRNSDVIGLNGLYFSDATENGKEGINFISSDSTSTAIKYNSIFTYRESGKTEDDLKYQPGRVKNTSTATVRTILHSGNCTSYTAGSANNVNTYYCDDKGVKSKLENCNIFISQLAPTSTNAQKQSNLLKNGSIWIKI